MPISRDCSSYFLLKLRNTDGLHKAVALGGLTEIERVGLKGTRGSTYSLSTAITPTKNEMKQLLDEARAERDSLKNELARAAEEKDELAQSLEEREAELVAAHERLNTAQEEIGRVGEAVEVIEELQNKVERLEWERDEADKGHEVSLCWQGKILERN